MIDDVCEAVIEIKIGKGNRRTLKKPAQRHFVHHKFHMT
jgi:hypothetical protein